MKPTPPRFRTAYDRGGELLVAVELRRLFPGIDDMANARGCARAIASWTPRPIAEPPAVKRRTGKRQTAG